LCEQALLGVDASKQFKLQPAAQTHDFFIRPGFDPLSASAYLFDIDGTLLNTRDGVHWNAFRTALREVFGIESLLDNIPVHGNTDIGILRAVTEQNGIAPTKFERSLPRALAIMRAEVGHNAAGMQCELCPSIRELLEKLRKSGKLLGVVSGNLESIAWKKIEAAGLRDFFSFGSFSDEAERRVEIFRLGLAQAERLLRQQPDDATRHWQVTTGDCIFVGDTPADVDAARAAGAPIIAVATGIYSFNDLLASFPDACVPCCSDLFGRSAC
jgi:phosphoglycolate phosphatase